MALGHQLEEGFLLGGVEREGDVGGPAEEEVEDAVGVVRRQGDSLDWDYVGRWVQAFAEVPGREALSQLLSQVRQEGGSPAA